MTAVFRAPGIIDMRQLIATAVIFPLFTAQPSHQASRSSIVPGAAISTCTPFYGSLLVMAGNAAAKRLVRNWRIAAFASNAAGIFLIGCGIKLTTN